MNGYRLIVCGGRKWVNRELTFKALDYAHKVAGPIAVIIHGATPDFRWGRSADWLAEDWAIERMRMALDMVRGESIVMVESYPVDHTVDGGWPAAGHRRNERMFRKAKADGCIAFPGERGTAGMVDFCNRMWGPGKVWLPYGTCI